ncbi:hypothetical protein [Lactiplantibacillus herbarum]|uniref:hypothetical protein n=1 Tax=Lactiplantibacillus herbarum TaxID=1670446 RepID=UPI00064F115E|nr:hypothetical protein [Lactiplantibacillus herbarum]
MLAVKVAGEYFDKQAKITYNGQVIHDGYIEDLVTSLDGELELEFNYGAQQVSSVIVKQFTNKIIFIPTEFEAFDADYQYVPVCLTIGEFGKLWQIMGYGESLEDSLKFVSPLTNKDLELVWVANSGVKGRFMSSVEEAKKQLNADCYYVDDEVVDTGVLFQDNQLLASSKIVIVDQKTVHTITIYRKPWEEWPALLQDQTGHLFLNTMMPCTLKLAM